MADQQHPMLPPDVAAEDKGPAIIISMSITTAIASLFLAARLFVRARILGKMHWDDHLITVSTLFGWVYFIMTIVGVKLGDGKHMDVLSDQQKSDAHFWTILGFAPGIMSFGFPKLAVVALLTRLLNPGKPHWYFLWTLAVLAQVNSVVNMALLYTQCLPTASMWDTTITDKYCRDPWILVGFAFYCGCFSAAVDFYLAVYPAIVLFHLQMPMKKKLGLSVALGFGSIATIVAIYKCTRLPSLASPDFSYDTADLVIWTSIESNTLVIAACVPILQPLIDRMRGKRSRAATPSAGRFSPYPPGAARPRTLPATSYEMSFACRGSGRTRRDLESVSEIEADAKYASVSQESILHESGSPGGSSGQRSGEGAALGGGGALGYGNGTGAGTVQGPQGGIMRTKVITISYDQRRPDSSCDELKSHPGQWRPRDRY